MSKGEEKTVIFCCLLVIFLMLCAALNGCASRPAAPKHATAIIAKDSCDCGKICGKHSHCHLVECPHG